MTRAGELFDAASIAERVERLYVELFEGHPA
jgi:hypothetical protein